MLASLLALQLASGSAHAAPTASTSAQKLFDEAKSLMKAGNYAPACDKLRESQSLEPALGTLLNLADCNEHIGLLASAWSDFRKAQELAKNDGQQAVEKAARARAEALEPRVPRLVVSTRATAEPSLELEHAGTKQAVSWGTALPLDPGDYQLRASAAGFQDWKTTLHVTEGVGTLTVTVPPLEPEVQAAPSAPVAPVATNSVATTASEPARPTHGIPTASWVLFGTGAAALGTSLVLGIMAKSQYNSADCPGNVCATQAAYDDRKSALGKATAANVAFAVGALAGAAGVVVWALHPGTPSQTGSQKLELRVGVGSLALGGSL